jgi:hypothetical protein
MSGAPRYEVRDGDLICLDCGSLIIEEAAHTRFHSILSGHAWVLAVLRNTHVGASVHERYDVLERLARRQFDSWHSTSSKHPGARADRWWNVWEPVIVRGGRRLQSEAPPVTLAGGSMSEPANFTLQIWSTDARKGSEDVPAGPYLDVAIEHAWHLAQARDVRSVNVVDDARMLWAQFNLTWMVPLDWRGSICADNKTLCKESRSDG